MVPKDRILEFNPKSGYKQLCEFLGKSVPADGQYPNINQPDNIFKLHTTLWWILLLLIAKRFAPLIGMFGVAAGAAWYYQYKA